MEQEIREALEKATKGPWSMNDMDSAYSNEVFVNPTGHQYIEIAGGLKIEDARLIAKAPTYLEWCLSQIAEQQALKEKSEGNIVTLLHEKEAMWNEILGLRMQIAELRKENERLKTCPDCGGSGVVELCHDPLYTEPCICTVDFMGENRKLHLQIEKQAEWIATVVNSYHHVLTYGLAQDGANLVNGLPKAIGATE